MDLERWTESSHRKPRVVELVCVQCGDLFRARFRGGKTAKTCSRTCTQLLRWSKPAYVCPYCKKEFRSRYVRKFCSAGCYHDHQVKVRPELVCARCGKRCAVAPPSGRPAVRGYKFYCSRRCYQGRGRKAFEIKKCIGCGKRFGSWKSDHGGRQFCSRDCYAINRPPLRVNWCEYSGVKFRSKWERAYAMWLDLKKIRWMYEPKIFRLSNGRLYKPDFFIGEPGVERIVELHRVRRPVPGDDRKIETLRLAAVEIPRFMLLDEDDMNVVRRELRQAKRLAMGWKIYGSGHSPPHSKTRHRPKQSKST